ncbi:MAG: helix-turn-helix transcriptional regulator [Pseudomonadota bacterium]
MTTIVIDAAQFKTIRRARKIGRSKLAKLSGISERQVEKIENSDATPINEEAMHRISEALRVPVLVLTGQVPPIDEDLQPLVAPKCTSGCCG